MTNHSEQRAQKRQQELEAELADSISQSFEIEKSEAKSIAEEIVDNSTDIKGPEVDTKIYMMTVSETGGQSTKPGNITYKPMKILEIVSSGALTAGSAANMPILAPFAAISLWASIWRGFSMDVSIEAAFVYYVLSQNSGRNDYVSRDELSGLVEQAAREEAIELHITEDDIDKSVSELKRIDSILVKSTEGTERYRGREWCRTKLE
jgi:hypothetical protein